jgi:hypothetical protein
MDKCTKERIQIYSMRTAASAAVAAGLWYLASLLTQHYGVEYTGLEQAGAAVVGLIGTWFATKPMFSFTEECILMQEGSSRRGRTLQVQPGHTRTAQTTQASRKSAATKPSTKPSTNPSGKSSTGQVFVPQQRVAAAASRNTASNAVSPVTLAAGTLFNKGRVSVAVVRDSAGQAEVTVTAAGLSASEFKGASGNNGMRQKLEKISGISWQNPKNLGDGKRVMVGVVKSSNEGEVAARLTEVASRYSA